MAPSAKPSFSDKISFYQRLSGSSDDGRSDDTNKNQSLTRDLEGGSEENDYDYEDEKSKTRSRRSSSANSLQVLLGQNSATKASSVILVLFIISVILNILLLITLISLYTTSATPNPSCSPSSLLPLDSQSPPPPPILADPSSSSSPFSSSSYESGFSTDFAPAKSSVRLLPFPQPPHGSLSYNKTTNLMSRHHSPSSPQYFGPPSPEIDAAWDTLMKGEFFALTDEEASAYLDERQRAGDDDEAEQGDGQGGPKLIRMPQTHTFHMELGVFHSLHCVNAVRKALYPSYYPASHTRLHSGSDADNKSERQDDDDDDDDAMMMPENWDQEHLSHCLENIMQTVTCHADLTPVPLYAWDGFGVALGVTQDRTCRDFDGVRAWLTQRNELMEGIDG